MQEGYKHLIECHCVLPQFKNSKEQIFHKFVVFSIIEDDEVQQKFAQCNNCGVIHKVIDICKSEISAGKDDARFLTNFDDIKLSLPKNVVSILEKNECDIATWEQAEWIYLQERWGDSVIISKNSSIDDEVHGKKLRFISKDKLKIEAF